MHATHKAWWGSQSRWQCDMQLRLGFWCHAICNQQCGWKQLLPFSDIVILLLNQGSDYYLNPWCCNNKFTPALWLKGSIGLFLTGLETGNSRTGSQNSEPLVRITQSRFSPGRCCQFSLHPWVEKGEIAPLDPFTRTLIPSVSASPPWTNHGPSQSHQLPMPSYWRLSFHR